MTFTVEVRGHIGYGFSPSTTELEFTLHNLDLATDSTPQLVDGTGVTTFPVTVAGNYALFVHDTHVPARVPDQYSFGAEYYYYGASDPAAVAATNPLVISGAAISAGDSRTVYCANILDLVLPAGCVWSTCDVVDNLNDWNDLGPGLYTVDSMTDATTVLFSGVELVTPASVADDNTAPGVFMMPVPLDGTEFAIRVTRVSDGEQRWIRGVTPAWASDADSVATDFADATLWCYNPNEAHETDRTGQVGHLTETSDYPGYLVFPAGSALPPAAGDLTTGVGSYPLQLTILISQTPAILTSLRPDLAAWTAEDTQRLNITFRLDGVLDVDVEPTDPPAGSETEGPDIIHYDFDGELVLDDNGRPV